MACFLSGRSSFISPGPDGTVTLNFNFPGCTTVCQPLFWHSNLHLYSSSQMNTLALVKTWIPLYSFPSSLLSKRGFLHSLALLLNCYLVARRCCYWMCEYGKWLAYFFFHQDLLGAIGNCIVLGDVHSAMPKRKPSKSCPSLPHLINGLLKCN